MRDYLRLLAAAALVSALSVLTAKGQQPYFALQPGDNQNRQLSDRDLKQKNVDGLTIRIRQGWLGNPWRWDFTFVDYCVARCARTGDRYTLLLMGGGPEPLAESNIRYYERAAGVLGSRYAGDPNCWGVHVTGCSPSGVSEELHWPRPMPRAAIEANKRLISAWAMAFPGKRVLLAISGRDEAAMKEIIAYGLQVAPGRFLVKHNSMKASTSLSATHNRLVTWAGQRGAMVGFEMVGSTLESRTGSLQKSVDNARLVARQAGQPLSYLAIYPPDLAKLGDIR